MESVLNYNQLANNSLKQGDVDGAFQYLSEAQKLLDPEDKELTAITYNTFGKYYKLKEEPQQALGFYSKALSLELKSGNLTNAATTHLTISAIKSELKLHSKALVHIKKAIEILRRNNSTLLALAYYSAGKEQEALKDLQSARSSYREGMDLAKNCFKKSHPLRIALKKKLAMNFHPLYSEAPKRRNPHARFKSISNKTSKENEHKPVFWKRRFTADDLIKELSSQVINVPVERPQSMENNRRKDVCFPRIIRNIITNPNVP